MTQELVSLLRRGISCVVLFSVRGGVTGLDCDGIFTSPKHPPGNPLRRFRPCMAKTQADVKPTLDPWNEVFCLFTLSDDTISSSLNVHP